MFRLPHEAILRGVRKLACIKTRLYIAYRINLFLFILFFSPFLHTSFFPSTLSFLNIFLFLTSSSVFQSPPVLFLLSLFLPSYVSFRLLFIIPRHFSSLFLTFSYFFTLLVTIFSVILLFLQFSLCVFVFHTSYCRLVRGPHGEK
jgi:hypothetical protein